MWREQQPTQNWNRTAELALSPDFLSFTWQKAPGLTGQETLL
jgi:hypothetical protein